MFYNVENLFDTKNDTLTGVDAFTPEGDMHWTSKRLKKKLLNISKVVLNASGWQVPDIVALVEVENRYVVKKLLVETPLKSIPYRIIHKESPDHRGLDVTLLYHSEHFYPLEYHYYPLVTEKGLIEESREILYVSGIMNGADTLHLFINHWPSRYSGIWETRDKRISAAKILRNKIDELKKTFRHPKIIIMGDFNDNPEDESIRQLLATGAESNGVMLANLSEGWLTSGYGTLKYQLQWFVFDQVIVSESLLHGAGGWHCSVGDAKIVRLPFLLERDTKFGGDKPFRTYYGFQYQGGFSDHLPILLQLHKSR